MIINVSGWIPDDPASDESTHAQFVKLWSSESTEAERYALVWEKKKLHALARSIQNFLTEQALTYGATTALKHTVLASIMAAVALPAALVAAASVIDNPWGVCVAAAEAAGSELANALLERAQGSR